MRQQGLELFAQFVRPLVHGRQGLVLAEHAIHAGLGLADRRRQAAEPVIERVEFPLVDRQPLDRGLQVFRQRAAFLVEHHKLARELLARGRRGGQLRARLLRELLHALNGFLGARDLLGALVQLGDLHIHGPHHFVEAVSLDDGAFDGVLLGFERLGLLRHVFGQGIERGETLFGVLAEFLQLHERTELLLDLLHGFGGRGRVILRLARGLTNARELLRQLSADRADRVELALERRDALHRADHLGGRDLELPAEILERGAFLAQRLDGGLVLERLRRQLVDREAVLLQLAVWGGDFFGDAMGLGHLVEDVANPLLDLIEALGPLVVAGHLQAKLIELLQGELSLLADLVESLAGLRQLRGPAGHLREHGAQRGAFFTCLITSACSSSCCCFLLPLLPPKSASSMPENISISQAGGNRGCAQKLRHPRSGRVAVSATPETR